MLNAMLRVARIKVKRVELHQVLSCSPPVPDTGVDATHKRVGASMYLQYLFTEGTLRLCVPEEREPRSRESELTSLEKDASRSESQC